MKKNFIYMVLLGVLVGCYEARNNSGNGTETVAKKDSEAETVKEETVAKEETAVVKEEEKGIESASNYGEAMKRAWESVRREYNSAVYGNENAEFPSVYVYGWELRVSPSEDGRKAKVSMNHQRTMEVYVSGEAEAVELLDADTYQDGGKVRIMRCKGLRIKTKGAVITLSGDKAVVAKEGKEEIWLRGSVDGKEKKHAFGGDAGIAEMVMAICGGVKEGKDVLDDVVEALKGKKMALEKTVDKENGYLKVEFGEGALLWGAEAKAWECESGARIVMMQWKDMEGIVRTRLYRVDLKEGEFYEIANTMSETDAEIRKEYGLDMCDWEYEVPKKDGEVVKQVSISKKGDRGKWYWYFDKGRNRFDKAG